MAEAHARYVHEELTSPSRLHLLILPRQGNMTVMSIKDQQVAILERDTATAPHTCNKM